MGSVAEEGDGGSEGFGAIEVTERDGEVSVEVKGILCLGNLRVCNDESRHDRSWRDGASSLERCQLEKEDNSSTMAA